MVVYGYLMYFAAMSLTDGSEHLMEILGPGIVSGLVLPILGALPDAMLVIGEHLFLLPFSCSRGFLLLLLLLFIFFFFNGIKC